MKLTGQVGKETKEFAYDVAFPECTTDDKEFVENLWARRKVGFLLDQILRGGEQKELMDEMLMLAKKYGIATPYTSFLVVPDAPMPVAGGGGHFPVKPMPRDRDGREVPPALFEGFGPGNRNGIAAPERVADMVRQLQQQGQGGIAKTRFDYQDKKLAAEEEKAAAAKIDANGGR